MTSPSGSGDDDRTVLRSTPASRTITLATPATGANVPDTHSLPLGTRLGEFELTERIGEGGFSIVYLAWDHSLERSVALKEYMPTSIAARAGGTQVNARSQRHRETFDAGLKSFINEAKLLARFDHRSLVKVYRFWEANGTAYMVMPFYEGLTLKDTVRALAQPPDEAWLLGLLSPLTEALCVIHAEHCYHRDIAPDNVILLAGSSLPLLLDFGAARRVIGDMTQALTVILKPGYAPVEQYAEVPGMRQGPWTDVYALAAVVYWAVTGKTPAVSVGRMMSDSQVPLAECAAGRYSASFLQAVDRALAVLPEQRTQSIDAFRQDLGLTALGLSNAAGSSRPLDPDATVMRSTGAGSGRSPGSDAHRAAAAVGPAARPGRQRAVLGAAAVTVALLAVGGWWALQNAPPKTSPPPAVSATAVAPANLPATVPMPMPMPAPEPQPVSVVPVAPPSAVPEAVLDAVAPVEQKPAHARHKTEAVKPDRRAQAPGNSAECARILQRQSLGESSPELIERVKLLGCR